MPNSAIRLENNKSIIKNIYKAEIRKHKVLFKFIKAASLYSTHYFAASLRNDVKCVLVVNAVRIDVCKTDPGASHYMCPISCMPYTCIT